ncbi:hypothetical protein HMI54_006480 [Coelomomyces lativittatus]|nr:hypothetical protein HMI54_006480 [Coelomomyces lativittatus]KAJ1506649.1 hypothetical protein HMI55_001086 [Coelomomyces lativittatus]KAJ1515871.1 hypothetical protein HMI56_007144 [Coelomomyces lativittatus]
MYFSFSRFAFLSCLIILVTIQYSQPIGDSGKGGFLTAGGNSNRRNTGEFVYRGGQWVSRRKIQADRERRREQQAQRENQQTSVTPHSPNRGPYSNTRNSIQSSTSSVSARAEDTELRSEVVETTPAAVPNGNKGTWIRAFLIPDPENTNPPPPMRSKK